MVEDAQAACVTRTSASMILSYRGGGMIYLMIPMIYLICKVLNFLILQLSSLSYQLTRSMGVCMSFIIQQVASTIDHMQWLSVCITTPMPYDKTCEV